MSWCAGHRTRGSARSPAALAWMIPGEVALFGLDELDPAKQWPVVSL